MNRLDPWAVAAITLTSILWGTTGTAATFAPEVGPLAIGAAALGIGGLLQAAVAVPALRTARAALTRHRPLIAAGAVAVAIYPLAFYTSMRWAGVAIGTVISLASAPVAAGLLERVIDGTPLSRWWVTSAGIGILGSTLLCLAKAGVAEADTLRTVGGIGLGLVAGTAYATYSWVVRRLWGAGICRAASMGAVFGSGGVLLMPVLLVTGAPLLASGEAFAVAAYMALVPMFLGYLLFGWGLVRVTSSTATTITLSEPAVAALLAVLVVGERLSALGWTGLAVIGLALVVLVLAPSSGSPIPTGARGAEAQAPVQRRRLDRP